MNEFSFPMQVSEMNYNAEIVRIVEIKNGPPLTTGSEISESMKKKKKRSSPVTAGPLKKSGLGNKVLKLLSRQSRKLILFLTLVIGLSHFDFVDVLLNSITKI